MHVNWIIQPPSFVRWLFPNSFWRGKVSGRKVVYLTFDDGPVPEQTPWVLDLLEKEGVLATFFCVGDNVRKYPEIFEDIVRRGHSVGNHTFNHLQLFKNSWGKYLDNVRRCSEVEKGRARLFRAPHGQMTPWRAWWLTKGDFQKVVFWDVMPKDYDGRLSPEEVLENVLQYVRPGSVIVFHDSIKAGERMRYALEGTIRVLRERGYEFLRVPTE